MQPHGLESGPDQLKGMGDSSREHTSWESSRGFVNSVGFHFLVHHVIQACKEAFFYTGGEPSTEESLHTFFLVDVSNGPVNAGILMEVSELEPGLDYVERVGDDGTDYSRDWRVQEIMSCVLVLLLEVL